MSIRSLNFNVRHWSWLIDHEHETGCNDSPGIDFDSVFDDAERALEATRSVPDFPPHCNVRHHTTKGI
jgi:hypothetical protein